MTGDNGVTEAAGHKESNSENAMTLPPLTAEEQKQLDKMHAGLRDAHMIPLWTEIGDLMPSTPTPRARPHVWSWSKTLLPLAKEAGRLVPVGRGGERRAIALANPGLEGRPFATPTLWAAIQYLCGHETAPEHRHSQNAFRFIVEGEGVWTMVKGDPVRMSRGDFLLTPAWHFHSHINIDDKPMAWIDGLDIPLVRYIDASFFDPGSGRAPKDCAGSRPQISRAERAWAHPGLRPVASADTPTISSPIAAYRWVHTNQALNEQLSLEDEGFGGGVTLEKGHAAVRMTNPTTGGDVLPTIRAQFHRLRPGTKTKPRREVGSSVYQIFEGSGKFVLDGSVLQVEKGDVVAVPSWVEFTFEADSMFDLFQFGDHPVMEKLHFNNPVVPSSDK